MDETSGFLFDENLKNHRNPTLKNGRWCFICLRILLAELLQGTGQRREQRTSKERTVRFLPRLLHQVDLGRR